MNLSKNKKSIDDITYAIKLSPDNSEWYKFRAAAYIKMKKKQDAIKDLDFSLILNPNDEQAKQYRKIAEEM